MHYQFHFDFLERYLPALIDGLAVTLLLAFVGILGGFAVGLGCALASTSRYMALRWTARVYVEAMRNTPMLVQVFVIFFGFPSFGIRLSPMAAAFTALVANNGGYMAEIIRAGIQSTHRSQVEASESLGLTYWQTLRYIVLPPAIERVFAPAVSQSVLLMLSTSIVSAIGVEDLTGVANIVASETFRSMEMYLVIAAIYLTLTYLFRVILAAVGLVLFTRSRRRFLGQA